MYRVAIHSESKGEVGSLNLAKIHFCNPWKYKVNKRTDLVLDEFAANVVRRTVSNLCITEYVLTGESLRTELLEK